MAGGYQVNSLPICLRMTPEPAPTSGSRADDLKRLAVIGAIFGVMVVIVPARFMSAPTMADAIGWTFRAMVGGVVGGALGGILVGALQSYMRGVMAFAIGALGVFLYCTIVVVVTSVNLHLSQLILAKMIGVSLVFGTLIGGLTRVVMLHNARQQVDDADGQPATVAWCIRFLREMTAGWFDRVQRRREAIRSQPFPDAWDTHIRNNIPYVSTLASFQYTELQKQVLVFLAEKNIEGCGGLKITDEIRVTVAAQACLLTLGGLLDAYADLRSVLIYPSTVMPATPTLQPFWYRFRDRQPIRGESWRSGVVILAWDAVLEGALDPQDGKNLVFHEFAHQLDQEDGAADGTPRLRRASSYRTWASVMTRDHKRLVRFSRKGRSVVLDPYGARDLAEFFAVATEAFFERPRHLRASWPELYSELRGYYGQDPATRPVPAAEP
jgi:MtfA peptidase